MDLLLHWCEKVSDMYWKPKVENKPHARYFLCTELSSMVELLQSLSGPFFVGGLTYLLDNRALQSLGGPIYAPKWHIAIFMA